jgi:NAD(P)-dependent dehydrogenase (short-subunit alcohol dehydrogenase family)
VIPGGRSAIVTGGAGGLGSATVRRLHGLGMGVVVFDLDADRADGLARELGGGVVGMGGDTASDAAIAAGIDAARHLGPLSVLVNVAGGGVGGGRIVGRDGTPHPIDSFVTTMAMNATGTFNMSRLVAAAMAGNEPDPDGQRGVVVNTASIAGMEGQSGQVAYGAAKAAILGMTLPMARDLAPLGIRVCAIAPGTMGTPPMLNALPHLKKDPVEGIVFPKRMGYPS